MKNLFFLSSLLLLNSSFAATYLISDNLLNTGDGTVTGTSEVETTGNYRQSDNVAGNPSGYNAIMVGSNYGGSDIYRAVTTFTLSDIPDPTPGFAYNVTDVSFKLEVSGGSNDGRPTTLIDFYEGSHTNTALPSTKLGSHSFNYNSGTFVTISLGAIDLDFDNTFSITMDAPNAAANPGGNFYTFGSGNGPNIGFGGTSDASLAPELIITYDIVSIPEPTSITLVSLGLLGLITRRKR